MAGHFGSGKYVRYAAKRKVEDCQSIDIFRWNKEGLLTLGNHFTWERIRNDGTTRGAVDVRVSESYVTLNYSYRARGEDWQDLEYRVWLAWTKCSYGGRRAWFYCPKAGCNRRVAKLYLGGPLYGCRHCYRLTYQSTSEHQADRALRKAQKLRMRLGGSPNMTLPFPPKPKRMRWNTYERLRAKELGVEKQYLGEMDLWLKKLR